MYYTSAMLNSRSKEGFLKIRCQVFLLEAQNFFVLLFIFMFLLNLVVYFYPRHLPAPATSTCESRPATFRHTPCESFLEEMFAVGEDEERRKNT